MRQLVWETAEELDQKLAQRVRNIRKRRSISQEKLASMSGVSYGSIKRFEMTGKISLLSLTQRAMALDSADELRDIFTNVPYKDIQEVINETRLSLEIYSRMYHIRIFRRLLMKRDNSLQVYYNERLVGTLAMTAGRKIAFQYSKSWIEKGFSISPFSLPLKDQVFIPTKDYFQGLFGVFADSLPEGNGLLSFLLM